MSQKIKIIIVGNGFGGTYALKNLHKLFHGSGKVDITLIGEDNYFLFTPLLHEVATGGVNPEDIIEPIHKIFACCLNKFYLGKAGAINIENKTVQFENELLSYDYLVLAPGAQTNYFNIKGAEEYAMPLKSINDAIKLKNHCITQMDRAANIKDENERRKVLKFVVVGGGPTGVELATELQELIEETFSHYFF